MWGLAARPRIVVIRRREHRLVHKAATSRGWCGWRRCRGLGAAPRGRWRPPPRSGPGVVAGTRAASRSRCCGQDQPFSQQKPRSDPRLAGGEPRRQLSNLIEPHELPRHPDPLKQPHQANYSSSDIKGDCPSASFGVKDNFTRCVDPDDMWRIDRLRTRGQAADASGSSGAPSSWSPQCRADRCSCWSAHGRPRELYLPGELASAQVTSIASGQGLTHHAAGDQGPPDHRP